MNFSKRKGNTTGDLREEIMAQSSSTFQLNHCLKEIEKLINRGASVIGCQFDEVNQDTSSIEWMKTRAEVFIDFIIERQNDIDSYGGWESIKQHLDFIKQLKGVYYKQNDSPKDQDQRIEKDIKLIHGVRSLMKSPTDEDLLRDISSLKRSASSALIDKNASDEMLAKMVRSTYPNQKDTDIQDLIITHKGLVDELKSSFPNANEQEILNEISEMQSTFLDDVANTSSNDRMKSIKELKSHINKLEKQVPNSKLGESVRPLFEVDDSKIPEEINKLKNIESQYSQLLNELGGSKENCLKEIKDLKRAKKILDTIEQETKTNDKSILKEIKEMQRKGQKLNEIVKKLGNDTTEDNVSEKISNFQHSKQIMQQAVNEFRDEQVTEEKLVAKIKELSKKIKILSQNDAKQKENNRNEVSKLNSQIQNLKQEQELFNQILHELDTNKENAIEKARELSNNSSLLTDAAKVLNINKEQLLSTTEDLIKSNAIHKEVLQKLNVREENEIKIIDDLIKKEKNNEEKDHDLAMHVRSIIHKDDSMIPDEINNLIEENALLNQLLTTLKTDKKSSISKVENIEHSSSNMKNIQKYLNITEDEVLPKIKQLKDDFDAKSQQLVEIDEQNQKLIQDIEASQKKASDLEKLTKKVTKQAQSTQKDLNEAKEKLKALNSVQSELESAKQELEKSNKERSKAQNELIKAKQNLAKKQASPAQTELENELQATKQELEKSNQEKQKIQNKLQKLQEELKQVNQEKTGAQEDKDKLNQEISKFFDESNKAKQEVQELKLLLSKSEEASSSAAKRLKELEMNIQLSNKDDEWKRKYEEIAQKLNDTDEYNVIIGQLEEILQTNKDYLVKKVEELKTIIDKINNGYSDVRVEELSDAIHSDNVMSKQIHQIFHGLDTTDIITEIKENDDFAKKIKEIFSPDNSIDDILEWRTTMLRHHQLIIQINKILNNTEDEELLKVISGLMNTNDEEQVQIVKYDASLLRESNSLAERALNRLGFVRQIFALYIAFTIYLLGNHFIMPNVF